VKKINSSFFRIGISLILLMVCVATGLAQEKKNSSITVVGTGDTKEAAIQDALRTAVERAMGVYIYSTTEVKNFQLVKDKIIASSAGYVNNYKVIKEKRQDDIYFLTLDVDVDIRSIETIVRKDIKITTFNDTLKDYALVTQRMDKLRRAYEIAEAIINRPLYEKYNVDFLGYEIRNVRKDFFTIDLSARLLMNPFYWNTYFDVIKNLAEDCKNENVRLMPTEYKKYSGKNKKRAWTPPGNYAVYTNESEKKICLHEDIAKLFFPDGDAYVPTRYIVGYLKGRGAFLLDAGQPHLNYWRNEYDGGYHSCHLWKPGKLARKLDSQGQLVPFTYKEDLLFNSIPNCGFLIPLTGAIITTEFKLKDPTFIQEIKNLKFYVLDNKYDHLIEGAKTLRLLKVNYIYRGQPVPSDHPVQTRRNSRD